MIRWALAGLLAGVLPGEPAVPAAHNKHLSYARVVLQDGALLGRIRMYRDDLEKALRRPVADDSATKASVAAYLNQQFGIRADGVNLPGEYLEQGADTDGDQPVWWVLVQWRPARPPRQLIFRDHVMFDLFSDQQNLLVIARMPQDDRRTLFFQAGDRREQSVSW